MAQEGLRAWGKPVEILYRRSDQGEDGKFSDFSVGSVITEVIEGNVVITVFREDEETFGPVSVVVR
jgi:hypothetical protein